MGGEDGGHLWEHLTRQKIPLLVKEQYGGGLTKGQVKLSGPTMKANRKSNTRLHHQVHLSRTVA